MRLADVETADAKAATTKSRHVCRDLERAVMLRAAGDGPAAAKAVEEGLQKAQGVAPPDRDRALLNCMAQLHAASGHRLMALGTQHAPGDQARLHALLGERKETLAELARQLKLPGTYPHALRVDPALASLWGDKEFLALVDNPASNAPVSFDAK